MNVPISREQIPPHPARETLLAVARWVLGVIFLLMGLSKALEPVEFLKLVREYGIIEHALTLNLIAVTLPWVEVVCGGLLLAGVAVRGTALLLFALLAAFSALIVDRALGVQGASGLGFCAIGFDCGCGSGEVLVCRKILENAGLVALCASQLFSGSRRFCWRHTLVGARAQKQ